AERTARRWVESPAAPGPYSNSPVARALLALAVAKLGRVDEALPLAAAQIEPTRANAEYHGARLAHLAYGVALRAQGDLAAARADEAAVQDPLTELGNRRSFDRQMAALDRPGDRTGPLVLLLIDVDRFKAINDTYSHGVGDRVLREVAAVLRAHCRPGDVPVR